MNKPDIEKVEIDFENHMKYFYVPHDPIDSPLRGRKTLMLPRFL